jgi:hypothetical protein
LTQPCTFHHCSFCAHTASPLHGVFCERTITAITLGIALTLFGPLYIYQSPTPPLITTMAQSGGSQSATNTASALSFTLSQTSRDPPTLLVTLKNSNPNTSYTILKWGTPLDSAALTTKIFTLTDSSTGAEIEQVGLMINRKMPPSPDELITVAPSTQEQVKVVFDKPWMPDTKPAKYSVRATGTFQGLWDKGGGEVREGEVMAYTNSPGNGETWVTNEIDMEVE